MPAAVAPGRDAARGTRMRRFTTPDPSPGPRQGTYSGPGFRPPGGKATGPGPTADGGYPVDSDLHQMSDDGGPVGPDPARWADPDWRDNLGERDTFDGDPRPGGPPPPTP